MEVYNEAWGDNWGFVPITEAEVEFQAKNLKPVLDENWAMIAEKDGEVVGAALTLPDVEQALAKMNGRLLPFGWWHFLRRKRYIDRLRVFALGVKHDYQHLGVAAALYERHVADGGRRRPAGRAHGLDPRDQRADEPRDGGDGRQGRPALPDLRAAARRRRDGARASPQTRSPRDGGRVRLAAVGEELLEARGDRGAAGDGGRRRLEADAPARCPQRAAGGRGRRLARRGAHRRARRGRRARRRRGDRRGRPRRPRRRRPKPSRKRSRGRKDAPQNIVASRSFLVDVHVLGR